MLNDRQIKDLGLDELEVVGPDFEYEAWQVHYVDASGKRYESVCDTDEDYAYRIACVNQMLRAMLEDYLERLEKWKFDLKFILNEYPKKYKNGEHIYETHKQKYWFKSRKAILEEGLNKPWSEISRILEENK